MESPRWTQRPKGSTWGDFGAEDQIGRLNLLTAQRRLAALAEVRTGESFCLSLPLDYPGGTLLNENRHPPILDRKSTRLNSSHVAISYAVFCLKKNKALSH